MQINRLFEIIYILLEKKIITAGELAERFNVSVRTIYRDIENLSSVGVPVYMSKGKGGGISILPDFILNKAVLTQEEKQDILSSIRAVCAVSLNNEEQIKTLNKLNNILGENNSDWIEVDFSNWENGEKEKYVFDSIKYSILNKNILVFDYFSSKHEGLKRTVCPLKLYFKGQSWYLYGFCKLRNDYRFFKLTRIKNIVISDENFEMKCPEKIFNDDNVSKNSCVQVKLRISKSMAYRVYDEFEDVEELEDGDFVTSMCYPMGEWLYSYIYTFGEYAEVLEPVELRNQMKSKIKRMLESYL
ncbi:MAG: YafY family protein [Clostridium sp.]